MVNYGNKWLKISFKRLLLHWRKFSLTKTNRYTVHVCCEQVCIACTCMCVCCVWSAVDVNSAITHCIGWLEFYDIIVRFFEVHVALYFRTVSEQRCNDNAFNHGPLRTSWWHSLCSSKRNDNVYSTSTLRRLFTQNSSVEFPTWACQNVQSWDSPYCRRH